MACLVNLVLFTCLLILQAYGEAQDHSELFLTPLIKAGNLAKAKELASDHMKQFHIKSSTNPKLTSFSGYLTIDEATNSNIFFWFFPALEKPETAPVIMSLNEAAGFSCLSRVFVDNGPFRVNEKLELLDNKYSWVNKYSLLYMDAPVGTGFSFTDRPEGYANKSVDDAIEVSEALQQFFTLFSEFKDRDFYLTGKIVSAIHIPPIVKKIEENNKDGGRVKINLKGVMLEAPFFNAPLHLEYAESYYNLGLVDEKQKLLIEEQETKVKTKLAEKKFVEAHHELFKIVVAPGNLYNSLTGLNNFNTMLRTEESPAFSQFLRFLDEKEVHEYLHAGFHKFEFRNFGIHNRFNEEFMSADGTAVQSLMGSYKVLFFVGQFDTNHVHKGVTAAVEALQWSGSNGFKGAPRKIWRVGGDVAGYAKTAGSATYVLVRNSGRYIMLDQPEWGFDLVQRFIENKPF